VADKNEAWDYFVQQKSAIDSISLTPWYKEIVEYWRREVEASQERLRTMKSEDIKAVQAELNLAKRFLAFLENILSANIDLSS
jgi:hypothetical protein